MNKFTRKFVQKVIFPIDKYYTLYVDFAPTKSMRKLTKNAGTQHLHENLCKNWRWCLAVRARWSMYVSDSFSIFYLVSMMRDDVFFTFLEFCLHYQQWYFKFFKRNLYSIISIELLWRNFFSVDLRCGFYIKRRSICEDDLKLTSIEFGFSFHFKAEEMSMRVWTMCLLGLFGIASAYAIKLTVTGKFCLFQ